MWGSKMPRQPYDTCCLYEGGSETNVLSLAAQAVDEHGSLPVTLPRSYTTLLVCVKSQLIGGLVLGHFKTHQRLFAPSVVGSH